MTPDPHDSHVEADEADLAEQRSPVTDEAEDDEGPALSVRDGADEGDLLEQSIPVPEDDDDRRD